MVVLVTCKNENQIKNEDSILPIITYTFDFYFQVPSQKSVTGYAIEVNYL